MAANYKSGRDLSLNYTYETEAMLNQGLIADNICVRYLCYHVVASCIVSRLGSLDSTGEGYSILTQDLLQAFHFWWFLLNFFIAGVTKGQLIDVPGLSLLTSALHPVSECEIMRLSAVGQIAKLTGILKNATPDLFLFFFEMPEPEEELELSQEGAFEKAPDSLEEQFYDDEDEVGSEEEENGSDHDENMRVAALRSVAAAEFNRDLAAL